MRGMTARSGARRRHRNGARNAQRRFCLSANAADVGDYVDPDAYPVSSFGSGVSDDVGEFQDPDYDLPSPSPYGGTLDIGDYLAPEEGP